MFGTWPPQKPLVVLYFPAARRPSVLFFLLSSFLLLAARANVASQAPDFSRLRPLFFVSEGHEREAECARKSTIFCQPNKSHPLFFRCADTMFPPLRAACRVHLTNQRKKRWRVTSAHKKTGAHQLTLTRTCFLRMRCPDRHRPTCSFFAPPQWAPCRRSADRSRADRWQT